MIAVASRFRACEPVRWNGRYARVIGDSGVLHLRYSQGRLWPVLSWETNAGVATCPAIRCDTAVTLADAVAKAKRHLGGEGGGAFVIDEFRRVLVPASDGGGHRMLVGRVTGPLLFQNAFCPREYIDLTDDKPLAMGTEWERPYIGVPYNLHRSSNIYFYQQDEQGGRCIYPPAQDLELIRRIRSLRPYGAVRILVTPGGLVLTKVPTPSRPVIEDRWKPVFVAAINPNLWFKEE